MLLFGDSGVVCRARFYLLINCVLLLLLLCLLMHGVQVGFHVPLLFSWYHKTKPAGVKAAVGDTMTVDGRPIVSKATFPVVPVKKKGTRTAAAVVTLGHGDM